VKSLPDLPTTTEAGMPQLQVSVWHGLYVPADTPPDVVQKLTGALKVALADQGVIDQMAKLGTAPVTAEDATPQAHRAHLDEQLKTWAKVIADAGVEVS
jgi:tripartite-type tricarboxylate transporter receptor subunit TctC